MTVPNSMDMRCDKCKVRNSCPRAGTSPLTVEHLRPKHYLCRIVGGYGRLAVSNNVLSEDSVKLSKIFGPSLTIAEIPTYIEGPDKVVYETVKIFARPILHAREQSTEPMDRIYPRSYNK